MSKFANTAATAEQKSLQQVIDATRNEFKVNLRADKVVTSASLSLESLAPEVEASVNDAFTKMNQSLESITAIAAASGVQYTATQRQAAAIAGVLASSPESFFRTPIVAALESASPTNVFIGQSEGLVTRNKFALESYDSKENHNTQAFTVAYNLGASQQTAACEAFFRTVVMNPDQAGIVMEMPLISVHDEVVHTLTADFVDFMRRNIVNAEVDATILKNDTLKIIPVFSQQTANAFVLASEVQPSEFELEGTPIMTAPLKVNHRGSLLRVSMTDALLSTGVMTQQDAIDPTIILESLILKLTKGSVSEVVKIDTRGLAGNTFNGAAQGVNRLMTLNFTSDDIHIGANTLLANGQPSTLLAGFAGPDGADAWLTVSLRGDVNLADSQYELNPGPVRLRTLKDNDGNVLDQEAVSNATLVDAFDGAQVIGFTLDARRVNTNLRDRGQLIDVISYRQQYGIKLGSPITIAKPVTSGDSTDMMDIAALTHTARTRQGNAAITKLFADVDVLRGFKSSDNIQGRNPQLLGISSFVTKPVLIEEDIDLEARVSSITQHERRADVKAILVDSLNNIAYRLWNESNYQAAANLFEGGQGQRPIIIVVTDPVTYQYLVIDGDTRTLGPGFTYQITETLDSRMRGKIFISFRYPGEQTGVPHPLSYGFMAYKPELVAAVPISRAQGGISRELIVHPSFNHVTTLGVLGVITVTNLTKGLTSKLVINTRV